MLREKVGISRVFIRVGYTDLRMGIDGLACLIQNYFDLNPFDEWEDDSEISGSDYVWEEE